MKKARKDHFNGAIHDKSIGKIDKSGRIRPDLLPVAGVKLIND
jgi:hypothetical protein